MFITLHSGRGRMHVRAESIIAVGHDDDGDGVVTLSGGGTVVVSKEALAVVVVLLKRLGEEFFDVDRAVRPRSPEEIKARWLKLMTVPVVEKAAAGGGG